MAGGDSRISNDVSGLGMVHQLEVIDAHSAQSGDFSEERQVGKDVVFFTPEGAAAYDALQREDQSFSAEKDPGRFMQWLLGGLGLKPESHQGQAEEP